MCRVSVTEPFGKNHLVNSDCALLSQGGKDGQRRRTHLSPTQVSCSISVITSAISNFSRCEGEGKQEREFIKEKKKNADPRARHKDREGNSAGSSAALTHSRQSLTSMSSRSSFFRRRMLDSSSLSSRERSSGTGRKKKKTQSKS